MNGHGSHTYKIVNAKNEPFFCKFHYKTDQGIRNLPVDRAAELASSDPDYALRDLYNAIAEKRFPSWTFYIQVMTFEQAENYRWNPFDVTKIWPHYEFPMIPVGKIVLDTNPTNYFKDVEQIAFCPSNLVPGIEPSPDKMLQSRLFSYSDTQRYRLGTNFFQIPVNCPYRTKPRNYQRDGPMTVDDNQDGAPNYFPNSFKGPDDNPIYLESRYCATGEVKRYNTEDDDNFTQVGTFYRKVLTADERTRLINNIVNHMKNAQRFIQERAIKNFSKADPEYGQRIKEGLLQLNAGHGQL